MGGCLHGSKASVCTNGTAADPYVRVALLSEKFWCWHINITLNAMFCQISLIMVRYAFRGVRVSSHPMKVVAQNRRARFDYEITDTVEAGIMLSGQEAKSCRLGQVSLAGSYVSFFSGTAVLKQMKITLYKYAGIQPDYDPGHDRKLLLKKNELAKIEASQAVKGVTIIPLEVRAGRFIKVLLGIAKGRKRLDKRQRIKDREVSKRLRQGREE